MNRQTNWIHGGILFVFLLVAGISLADKGGIPHRKPTPAPSPSSTPLPPPPTVTLTWDSPGDSSITGYALFVGFASGTENQETGLGLVLTTTLSLTSGTKYFFVVKSYNSAHQMSAPSNEVSYLAP